ncbi:MAG: UvrD-helicase domain-containing protein, partial [Planctomycetes bacterium]|nr:UvrD-helicase domain-containing protein [Planctomycetota bacterium]
MKDLDALFERLNAEQRRAVECADGTFRILAGPGTGKTETLARRFAYLLATGRANEGEIVLLTFSRRAAIEVRGRVAKRLGSSHGALRVTTFHAFGQLLLRDNAALAGLSPNFDVLTPFKGWLVVRLAAERAKLPPTFERVRRSPTLHAEAQRLVSALKQCAISPKRFEDAIRGEHSSFELRTLAAIYTEYERLLGEIDTVDVDDLVGRAVHLLESADSGALRLAPIRYLLVDEYQDTNPMQARLLAALATRVAKAADGRTNLCVIGDPDQSIYRFRGTTAENLLHFDRAFPLSDGGDVHLTESYRSVPEVLETAAALNRLYRRGDAPVSHTRRPSGGVQSVQSVREDTAPNEAFFIV